MTFDPYRPFYERILVFTGGMLSRTRHTAQQAVVNEGGRPMTSVGKKASYVVVGGSSMDCLLGTPSATDSSKRWS